MIVLAGRTFTWSVVAFQSTAVSAVCPLSTSESKKTISRLQLLPASLVSSCSLDSSAGSAVSMSAFCSSGVSACAFPFPSAGAGSVISSAGSGLFSVSPAVPGSAAASGESSGSPDDTGSSGCSCPGVSSPCAFPFSSVSAGSVFSSAGSGLFSVSPDSSGSAVCSVSGISSPCAKAVCCTGCDMASSPLSSKTVIFRMVFISARLHHHIRRLALRRIPVQSRLGITKPA